MKCDMVLVNEREEVGMASELYDKGMKIRRAVLGDDYVDRALASVDDFNREFQQMVTEHAWGAIWARPGLAKKQRSLINLAMLAALNRPEEFELHFRGALKNGCTREELKETLLQIGVSWRCRGGAASF